METQKKYIDHLSSILIKLEKEEVHLCIVHLKSAEELLEKKFSLRDYPEVDLANVKKVIETLDRGAKFNTKADVRYYGKLIDAARKNLHIIHGTLSSKLLKTG